MTEPSSRQLKALGFVMLLSPATRLLPGAAAREAGHAGWLAPLLAIPFSILVSLLVGRAMSKKEPGEGLGELITRRSPCVGRAFCGLYALYLALYAGFALRSAASRFIYTIYTGASPLLFVGTGLALALIAALGRPVRLLRTAELFRPLLILTLLPILAAGLAQADLLELLPVTPGDAAGLARGALISLGTLGFAILNTAVLDTGEARPAGAMAGWCARECVFFSAIIVCVLGRFGPELSGALTYPFFALVRNTGLSGVAERIEALVTALWVLSDFVLSAFSLMAASRLLRLSLGLARGPSRPGSVPPRTLATCACAAAALACALMAAPDSRTLRYVSDTLVVWVNLGMCGALLLLTLRCALSSAPPSCSS